MLDGLRLRLSRGAALREPEIQQMWQLRESLTPLKPGRDVEAAWSAFRSVVESSVAVGRLTTPDGRVAAMLSSRIAACEFEGISLRLLMARNGFVARDQRSHPLTMLMYAAVIARCCTLRPGVRHYFCVLSAPAAVVRFGEMSRVFMPGLPDLSPVEQFILDEILRRDCPEGWDGERPAVDVGTVPEPPSERWLARHRAHPLWVHYQRQLPTWDQGYSMPMAARIEPMHIYRAPPKARGCCLGRLRLASALSTAASPRQRMLQVRELAPVGRTLQRSRTARCVAAVEHGWTTRCGSSWVARIPAE